MKFDFEKYKGQKVAMHCKTEQEAIDFCNYMHENGKRWFSGRTYKQATNYSDYGSETCYWFNNGTYASRTYAIEEKIEILEWSDYMNKVFTKSDLKNGDVLIKRNGCVEIAIPETGITIMEDGHINEFIDINEDLTSRIFDAFDIVKVYRPKETYQCDFANYYFTQGKLIFDRDVIEPIEVTLEEIAALKGVSVDRIRIKD